LLIPFDLEGSFSVCGVIGELACFEDLAGLRMGLQANRDIRYIIQPDGGILYYGDILLDLTGAVNSR
jgi:hypothetical protein